MPNAGYVSASVGAPGFPLSCTSLPAITASRCGGYRSESSVLGTIPARLPNHSLFTIARSPPAFVPEKPAALFVDVTSVITAWQGEHCPM